MTHSLNIERGFYKRLKEDYTKEQVQLIKGLVKGLVDPYNIDVFPKTTRWIKSCYNSPSQIEQVMSAIDEVLENHGVEGFRVKSREWATYSNTGDTYALTVVYFRGKFRACSWGDIAEKYGCF